MKKTFLSQHTSRSIAALCTLLFSCSQAYATDSMTVAGVQDPNPGFPVKGATCTFLSNGPAGIGQCYELFPGERRGQQTLRPIGVNVPAKSTALPSDLGKFETMQYLLASQDDGTFASFTNVVTYLQDDAGFIHTITNRTLGYANLGTTDGYTKYAIYCYAKDFSPVVDAKPLSLSITYGPTNRFLTGEYTNYISDPIIECKKGTVSTTAYKTENDTVFNVESP